MPMIMGSVRIYRMYSLLFALSYKIISVLQGFDSAHVISSLSILEFKFSSTVAELKKNWAEQFFLCFPNFYHADVALFPFLLAYSY